VAEHPRATCIREQLAAGGVLAKMVTFRDLVKYGLLDLYNAGIFDPPDDDGSAGVSGVQLACWRPAPSRSALLSNCLPTLR